MSADRNEPKPFLSWWSAWVCLEIVPLAIVMLVAACMGRWWGVPQSIWASGRDTNSKELWISLFGVVFVVGLLWMGRRWLQQSSSVGTGTKQAISIQRSFLCTALLSLSLGFLTFWQVYGWYRDGWTPKLSPHIYGELDYRYFKSLDLRLQQIANKIREGRVASAENHPLRIPAASLAKEPMKVNSKQIVSEVREYILDWSEEAYARSQSAQERDATLRMLAMMIDPDPHYLDQYLKSKAEEESRLELAVREATLNEESTKKEHEAVAVQWSQETMPDKKSALANQLVGIEDKLNSHVRERVRVQGRLDVLANEHLDQRGLNRDYSWLHLPTVSRGGWLRIFCTWLAAIYLGIRFLVIGGISVAGVVRVAKQLKIVRTSDEEPAGDIGTRGECIEPLPGVGWFLIAAALWWLGLGW